MHRRGRGGPIDSVRWAARAGLMEPRRSIPQIHSVDENQCGQARHGHCHARDASAQVHRTRASNAGRALRGRACRTTPCLAEAAKLWAEAGTDEPAAPAPDPGRVLGRRSGHEGRLASCGDASPLCGASRQSRARGPECPLRLDKGRTQKRENKWYQKGCELGSGNRILWKERVLENPFPYPRQA